MEMTLVDDEVDEPTRTSMVLEIRAVMLRAHSRSGDPLFRRLISGLCEDICDAVDSGGTRAEIMDRVSPMLENVGRLENTLGSG